MCQFFSNYDRKWSKTISLSFRVWMEQKINLLINVNYLKLHSHAISFLFSVAVQTQYTSFSGTKSSQYDVYIFVLLFVISQTLQNLKKHVATNILNIITLLLNSMFSFIIIYWYFWLDRRYHRIQFPRNRSFRYINLTSKVLSQSS